MTDRFVTVPDSLELPPAVIVPVARVSGLGSAATTDATDYDPAGTAAAAVSAHEAAADPHPGYTTPAEAAAAAPVQSVDGQTGAVSLSSTYVAKGYAESSPAPLLSSLPVVAETVTVSASAYDATTGTFHGTSSANGHYMTSTDLDTWTDRTYSPVSHTPKRTGMEFDETYMYAYSTAAKVWRATRDVFNSWAEITPPDLGPLTTGRPGSLAALGGGVLLYGNYTSAAGDGAHIWRSADYGDTWTEVLTLAAAKHIHAIRYNMTTGNVWASVGDATFDGIGLYRSTDDGLTWTHMSSNDYGIDMVFIPAQGQWPDLVVLEGDGLNRPHIMAFPEDGEVGDDTFPLVWGWSGPTTDPLSWRGTARGISVLPGNHLLWYTTTESGSVGQRAGVWLALAPDYSRVYLLRETTGAEPNYGATFHTDTWVQNTQRRYAVPTIGSY